MSKKIDATIKEYNRIMDKFMDAIKPLPVHEQLSELLEECSKYNICPSTTQATQKQKRNSQSSEEEPTLTK